MFSLCRNFYKWVKKRREKHITIIVLGLDNAGKTTLIYGLKSELPDSDVIPTMGFSSSKLVSGKYIIQYFDVGGAKNFRGVWKNYYSEVGATISENHLHTSMILTIFCFQLTGSWCNICS